VALAAITKLNMRISFIFIIVIFLSQEITAQIDSSDFFLFSISKISPEFIDMREYNDSTDNFTIISVERYYSIITKDSLIQEKLTNQTLLKKSDWLRIKKILNPSENELNKLTDWELADCYIPRHAMIFHNANDEIIGLIEICFECQQTRTYGICDNWKIIITPNGFKKLENIYRKNNLINKKKNGS